MNHELFVKYLFVDDVRRPSPAVEPESGVTHEPSMVQIIEAIGSLDGTKVRLVVLGERSPDPDSGFPYTVEREWWQAAVERTACMW